MKNLIIAFSGKARSGKSKSTALIKELIEVETGNNKRNEMQQLSFAGSLKEIAKFYFGWDGDKNIHRRPVNAPDIDGDETEIIPDKGRQLLINIGSKFREIRSSIWADIILKKIKDLDYGKSENVIYCIDDLRFKNEIDVLKSYGRVAFIRLNRPWGQENLDDPTEKNLDDHKFEYYVENDGTLDELKEKLSEIYKDILKRHS